MAVSTTSRLPYGVMSRKAGLNENGIGLGIVIVIVLMHMRKEVLMAYCDMMTDLAQLILVCYGSAQDKRSTI